MRLALSGIILSLMGVGACAVLADARTVGTAAFVAVGAICILSVLRGLVPRPWAYVVAGLAAAGMALFGISAAYSAPLVLQDTANPLGLTYSNDVRAQAWADPSTGQGWAKLTALSSDAEALMMGWPEMFTYFDGVGLTQVSATELYPLSAGAIPLAGVQGAFDDTANLIFGNGEPYDDYLYDEGDAVCAVSCASMRNQSEAHDAAVRAEARSALFLAGTTLVGSGGSLATSVFIIESSSTSVLIGAGGQVTLAAFGLLLTSAVLALGGAALLYYVLNEASYAGAAFDANPANGCPDCGGTVATQGWFHTGTTDMCANPACEWAELDDEAPGHKDEEEPESTQAPEDPRTHEAPEAPEREHYGGSSFDGGLGTSTDVCHAGDKVECAATCEEGWHSCTICTLSADGCVYFN